MANRLQQMWARKGRVLIWDIGFGHYVARFEDNSDYLRAVLEGPWLVGDHYVLSEEWRLNFEPGFSQVNSIRVWIRLPGIPIEYFDDGILRNIGNRIGTTVRVDNTTSFGSRGNYARICVEIDLHKPLVSKYRLNRRVRRVEYEGLHEICFHCGRYGHDKGSCPVAKSENEAPAQETVFTNPVFNAEVDRPEVDEEFGPWMLAKKKARRRNPRTNPDLKTEKAPFKSGSSGSRFTSLAQEVNPDQESEEGLVGNSNVDPLQSSDGDVTVVTGGVAKMRKPDRKLDFAKKDVGVRLSQQLTLAGPVVGSPSIQGEPELDGELDKVGPVGILSETTTVLSKVETTTTVLATGQKNGAYRLKQVPKVMKKNSDKMSQRSVRGGTSEGGATLQNPLAPHKLDV
ncbi:Uncharacterized protein At4g02000 [Linum perenne]